MSNNWPEPKKPTHCPQCKKKLPVTSTSLIVLKWAGETGYGHKVPCRNCKGVSMVSTDQNGNKIYTVIEKGISN